MVFKHFDGLRSTPRYREGIGVDIAEGSALHSPGKYGGEDFAPHVQGMELRPMSRAGAFGHGLGYTPTAVPGSLPPGRGAYLNHYRSDRNR